MGERPPKGVKKLVLELAGTNPRPTNKEIREAVRRRFEGIEISYRTISRYCSAAVLPRSTLAPNDVGQKGSGEGSFGDALVAELRLRHHHDLWTLAAELRDQIGVIPPEDMIGNCAKGSRIGTWVADARGKWLLSVESHELHPYLKAHLAGLELWSCLESLRTSLPDYREECLVFLAAISVIAQTRRYAGCPIVQSVGERLPAITRHYAGNVYQEASRVAGGRSDFGEFSYERRPSFSDVNALVFRAQDIAYGTEADVDQLESAHRRLRKRFLKDSRARNIVAISKPLGQAIDVAVAGLEPNLARKLIYAGVCERCP